ncbi:MAG: hypothetical protein CXT70_04880 [Methanobacteriota archaeon]|nr:MAG: hypothetical protein CXT70_04880 [Euryarchaeota archaeon]
MQVPKVHPIGATGIVVNRSGRPANMMNMMDSVITCLRKYVDFEGRASRSEYWWFYLAYFIASLITGVMDAILFGMEMSDPTWLTWILYVVLFLPVLAVGIRRIHDHGMSGWYCMVPFYNVYLWIIEGEAVPNMYGPVPTNVMEGKSGFQHVIAQQPMQQQYQQQPMNQHQPQIQQQYQQQPMNQQQPQIQQLYQQPGQQQNQQPQSLNQQQPQNPQILYQQVPQQKNGMPVAVVIVIVVAIIAFTTVLAGVLYVWAASLAESDIEGTWHNPDQTFTFNSDGSLEDSTGEWDEWRTNGNYLYLTTPSDPDYEYYFKYSISDEILFLAPYGDDDSVISDSCSAYAINGVDWEDAGYYTWPSWCASE